MSDCERVSLYGAKDEPVSYDCLGCNELYPNEPLRCDQIKPPYIMETPVIFNLKSLVQGLHIHVHGTEDAKLVGDAILAQLNRASAMAASLSDAVVPEPFTPDQEKRIQEIAKDTLVDLLVSQREARINKSDESPA